MAAPNLTWDADTINGAKAFYATNPSADAIHAMGSKLGASAEQMNDLWAQATGGDYDKGLLATQKYLTGNNKTLAANVPGATNVGGDQVIGNVAQYKPAGTPAPVAAAAPVPTTVANAQSNTTANYAATPKANYTPKFDISNQDLKDAGGFFMSNPSDQQIYDLAKSKGMSAELLAESYVRSVGGDYDQVLASINNYVTRNNLAPLVVNSMPIAPGPTTGSNGTYGYNNTNNVAKANAVNWDVSPNQTVESRMAGLLSQNNPLVQMAQTQGLEAAQQRGLLNSSMAAESGAMAHYQYALPIAQSDATTFGSAARQNASDNTNVNLQNANSLNQRSTLETNFANTMEKTKVDAANELARLDKANANAIAALDPQYAQQVRQNYTVAMTTAQSQYQSFVDRIQMSDMPAEAKTSQINEAQVSLNNTIAFMNQMYSALPNWSKEWSMLNFN